MQVKFLDVSSVLGLLHCVVVGIATNISELKNLQNSANITHIHTVQQHKNRINFNNKLPWEPKNQ